MRVLVRRWLQRVSDELKECFVIKMVNKTLLLWLRNSFWWFSNDEKECFLECIFKFVRWEGENHLLYKKQLEAFNNKHLLQTACDTKLQTTSLKIGHTNDTELVTLNYKQLVTLTDKHRNFIWVHIHNSWLLLRNYTISWRREAFVVNNQMVLQSYKCKCINE